MNEEKLYYLGNRPYDFKDESSGRQIAGVTVWLASSEENAEGLIAFKVSMQPDAFAMVFSGFDTSKAMQLCEAKFNRHGKLASIKAVPSAQQQPK